MSRFRKPFCLGARPFLLSVHMEQAVPIGMTPARWAQFQHELEETRKKLEAKKKLEAEKPTLLQKHTDMPQKVLAVIGKKLSCDDEQPNPRVVPRTPKLDVAPPFDGRVAVIGKKLSGTYQKPALETSTGCNQVPLGNTIVSPVLERLVKRVVDAEHKSEAKKKSFFA